MLSIPLTQLCFIWAALYTQSPTPTSTTPFSPYLWTLRLRIWNLHACEMDGCDYIPNINQFTYLHPKSFVFYSSPKSHVSWDLQVQWSDFHSWFLVTVQNGLNAEFLHNPTKNFLTLTAYLDLQWDHQGAFRACASFNSLHTYVFHRTSSALLWQFFQKNLTPASTITNFN